MDSSLTPSLSDFVDDTYDDSDDAETMTAAQVLTKLEEVNHFRSLHFISNSATETNPNSNLAKRC